MKRTGRLVHCGLCDKEFWTDIWNKKYCCYDHQIKAAQWRIYKRVEKFKMTIEERTLYEDYIKRLKE